MKIASFRGALAAVIAALGLVPGAPAFAEAGFPPTETTLPIQTRTHFFEVYHCGELAGVVWITPGEAALFRLQSLSSPQVRKEALDIRAKAREQGTAFAVQGRKGGCTDA